MTTYEMQDMARRAIDEVAMGNLERFSLAPMTDDDRLAITGGGAS